jgi:cysteine desulfurase
VLENEGATVHRLPVNREGQIDLTLYEKVLSERVALVSIMAANNETGSLFPVKQMAELAHKVGAKFHTDAVQTAGKIAVNFRDWDVDYASFASHKIYALRGAGLAYARKGERLKSLISGGGQERGRRAGTENILAIAAFGYVAGLIEQTPELKEKPERMRELRDALERQIAKELPGVKLTGAGVNRLPNTSSLVIDNVDGESMLMNLDLEGVSVSTGAACSSGNPEPSPTLLAMGLSRHEAQSSLRVSLGWETTAEDISTFVEKLKIVVLRLREFRNAEKISMGGD